MIPDPGRRASLTIAPAAERLVQLIVLLLACVLFAWVLTRTTLAWWEALVVLALGSAVPFVPAVLAMVAPDPEGEDARHPVGRSSSRRDAEHPVATTRVQPAFAPNLPEQRRDDGALPNPATGTWTEQQTQRRTGAGPPQVAGSAVTATLTKAELSTVAAVEVVSFEGGTRAGAAPWLLPPRPAQSGIAADAARLGDLEVRAASVVGAGHRCEEPATERQDAYGLARTSSGEYLVVAVADGVSNSESSELGARVAVLTATRALCRHLDDGFLPETLDPYRLFADVAGAMVGTGKDRGILPQALQSVLVVAVVPTTPDAAHDGRRVWTAQVGDVSLWLHGAAGWDCRTGGTKAGLDRNAVDGALPFDVRKAVSQVVDVPPGAGVALMTDGLGDLLTNVRGAADYLSRRWANPPHPAAFVADLCADARGQTDDRTAVVVWCGTSRPGRRSA